MEKRTFLAIALSMLILLAWSVLVPKPSPVRPVSAPASAKVDTAVISEPVLSPSSVVKFNQDKFEVVFLGAQAAIKEVIFKDYQSWSFRLGSGFLLADPNLNFIQDNSSSADTAIFTASDNTKRIVKRFTFHNSNYIIDLDIEIQNISAQSININLPLFLGVLNFSTDPNQARFQDITVALPDKTLHPNVHKESSFSKIRFLAFRDRYFCSIIEPTVENNYTAFIKKSNPQEYQIGLIAPEASLLPRQKTSQHFRIYLGPQELHEIAQIKPEWTAVMYYGTFDFIAQLLLQLVEFLYRFTHNWGLAIIILSILIYFMLYPLSLKQMRSMKEMQALQPRIEELKKAYKDNPQKLNKEIMELYREHKVNPLGGCLPMLLQIPIFFALYQTLIRSIALKGAKFLWIKDLSKPDSLFSLPASLPVKEINLLPILMTVIMLIQQRITSSNLASGSSTEQQKLMMILMPAMFLFIFYSMPAGLVLYWLVNSALMLVYQFKINRQE
jgi:YidC/Oxa1 family membrane protein insertase